MVGIELDAIRREFKSFFSNLNIQTLLQSVWCQSPLLFHLEYVCVVYLSFFFVFSFIKIHKIQTTAQMDDFVFFMIFIYRNSIQFYNLFFFLVLFKLFIIFVGCCWLFLLLLLSSSHPAVRYGLNPFFCFNFQLNYLLVFFRFGKFHSSIVCCFLF